MACLVAACDPNRQYEKNVTIKNYIWHSQTVPEFLVEIKDTSLLYNLFLNIRHTTHYPYRNIWLIVGMTAADGSSSSKQLEILLGDEKGMWFGDGLGDIWDYRTLIQQNAYFAQPGLYRFTLAHNMRQDPLPGIMAVGIRLERAGPRR